MSDSACGTCSRRALLVQLAALVAACSGAESVAPTVVPGVRLSDDAIELRVELVPQLREIPSALVIGEASTVVLRVAPDEFRAFSNVCTHAGCGIHRFAGARLHCACHGSEFDLDGKNVAGPALTPLLRRVTAWDAASRVLRVMR